MKKLTFVVLVLMVLIGVGVTACGMIKGEPGAPGANGSNGKDGQNGKDGADGKDAEDVTVVQLCKNQATHYPSSFPEKALCVGGKLFGVYWDGTNTWLAELPPGTYKSTATGLQCTFTISDGCNIQ